MLLCMNDELLIECNKLITDFMGYKTVSNDYWEMDRVLIPAEFEESILGIEYLHIDHGTGDVYVPINELRFYTSWDWLMLVVEKIESIQDNHHGYFSVHIRNNCCSIQGTKLYKALENLSDYGPVYFSEWGLDSKLKSTYNEVINFIIFYNEDHAIKPTTT